MVRIFITLIFTCIVSFSNQKIYDTVYPWEIDSVFVAFLIKNYIDKDAMFIAKDKNESFSLNSINTANSYLKRDARYTALEVAMKKYNIKEDYCLKKLKKIVKLIEMYPWKKPLYPKIMEFETNLLNKMPKKHKVSDLKKQSDFIYKYCKGK